MLEGAIYKPAPIPGQYAIRYWSTLQESSLPQACLKQLIPPETWYRIYRQEWKVVVAFYIKNFPGVDKLS
jgi:hypothetical protein